MNKDKYMKKRENIVRRIKQVVEKCEAFSIKKIEENEILEIGDIYEYIRNVLETNISTFYLRVETVWKHECISKEEKEKLDELYPKLIAYQRKINYLRNNHELVEKVEDIIEKSEVLKISELYEYIKAKEITPHKIKLVTQSLYKNDCMNKDKKEQFDKKYTELVDYIDSTKEIREKENYNKKYSKEIGKLIELSKQEKLEDKKLYEYIKRNYNYDLNALKLRVKTASKYAALTKEQIESLDNIFQRVEKYREKNKKTPARSVPTEKLKIATCLIEGFIESGKSFQEYCCENNLISYQYDEYLRALKRYNPTLYKKYISYLKLRKKYIREIIANTKDDLLDKIENGIVLEDNSTREFDIIDYYLLTGTPIDEYGKELKETTDNVFEILPLLQFCNTYSNEKLPLKEIKGFLDCTFIKNGVEITEDIKIEIFYYLQSHMIPLTNITIRTAINRYLNNALFEKQNYTYNKK